MLELKNISFTAENEDGEKERYAYIFPNHYYLAFTITTIYSANIKEIHLTQQ